MKDKHSELSYLRALLTSELEDIFAKAPRAPAAIAHERIRNAYAQATGKKVASSSQSGSKKRLPGEEDDCPICYENMHREAESKLTFCEECGNGLHKICFQQCKYTLCTFGLVANRSPYASGANTAKNGITCVFCRAKWPEAAQAGASRGARSSEGYLNLGGVAGVSTVRDTSSCRSMIHDSFPPLT